MGIRKKMGMIFRLVAVILLCGCCVAGVSAETEEERVLFISSYSYSWETVPEQMEGIKEALGEDVILDYKFMDTKNVTSSESEELFYQSMKQYLSEVPSYDALIVGDDAAFQFALKYQEEFFKDVPIAFEAVNDIDAAAEASKEPLITGVTESLSYKNTISLAYRLYPGAKRIVAVLDDTITGEVERKAFYSYDEVFETLNFEEINASEMPQEDLKKKIASLKEDSILLYIMCSEDADGNHYIGSQGIEFVSSNAKIPVFSIVSHGMGHGLLGGEMVSQKQMGKIAAQMVKKYLDGEDFSKIGLQTETPKLFCFDEDVMRKYDISVSALPKNVEIINHRQTFIEKNIAMIRISLIIFAVLLLIVCVLLVDNVHRRRLNNELEKVKLSLLQMVRYDTLTGLYNRSVFMKTVKEKITKGEQFALVLYDIDHFKDINDKLGHNNGDIVLKGLADRVKEICDDNFTVYRLAGDEFTAIINDCSKEVVVKYLEKIQSAFREPFLLAGEEYNVHSSIGVAIYPQDASDQTDLIAAADTAMYQVKNSGRNAYAFYQRGK